MMTFSLCKAFLIDRNISFPFEDPVVVIRVTGKALWEALENGVHNYPGDEKSGKQKFLGRELEAAHH